MENSTFFILLLLLFLGIAINNIYKLNRARKEALNRLHYLVSRNLAGELLPDEELVKIIDLSNDFVK
jgi:hypothetical protein